jgi:hypothetical protein
MFSVWFPSRKFIAKADPKRNRSSESLKAELEQHSKLSSTYQKQAESAAEEVRTWSLDKYLDVIESLVVVNRTRTQEEMCMV